MKKVIYVDGMMCEHCKKKVETAVGSVVKDYKVDLKKKCVVVNLKDGEDVNLVTSKIEEKGFKVVKVEDKKGLFGL